MASFLAPTVEAEKYFSPYISTANAELYTQLIVGKQQAYEEGVQRIQSYIDHVTGLEVRRPQDMAYLQKLSGDLRTNIESLNNDFSDPNIIRKAEGYFHGTYNDPKLRGMVMSNMYAKDYEAQKQKAIEEGTYAPQNFFESDKRVMEWMQGDENATLGKQTVTPWFDHTAGAMEYLKSVMPDVTFTYDNGDINGYTIVNNKRLYIPESRLRSALNVYYGSNAQASTQLALDVNYFSQGMTVTEMEESLMNTYENNVGKLEREMIKLEKRKTLENSNEDAVAFYEDELTNLRRMKDNLADNLADDLMKLSENPDLIRRKLYTEGLYSNLLSTNSRVETKSEIETNPLLEATLDVRQDQRAEQKAIQDQINWEKEYNLKLLKAQNEGRNSGQQVNTSGIPAPEGVSALPVTNVDGEVEGALPLGLGDGIRARNEMRTQVRNDVSNLISSVYADKPEVWQKFMRLGEDGNWIVTDADEWVKAQVEIEKQWEAGTIDNPAVRDYYESTSADRGVSLARRYKELSEDVGKVMSEEATILGGILGEPNTEVFKSTALDRKDNVMDGVTVGDIFKVTMAYYDIFFNRGESPMGKDINKQVSDETGLTLDNVNKIISETRIFGVTTGSVDEIAVKSEGGKEFKITSKWLKDNAPKVWQTPKTIETLQVTPPVSIISTGKAGDKFQETKHFLGNYLKGKQLETYSKVLKHTDEKDLGFIITQNPATQEFSILINNGRVNTDGDVASFDPIPISHEVANNLTGGYTRTITNPYNGIIREMKRGNGKTTETRQVYGDNNNYIFRYEFYAPVQEISEAGFSPYVKVHIKPKSGGDWKRITEYSKHRWSFDEFYGTALPTLRNLSDEYIKTQIYGLPAETK